MGYFLTEEELELENTVRKFFSEQISSEYLRERINNKIRNDTRLWKKIDELGVLEIFGADPDCRPSFQGLSAIAYQAGRALFPECIAEIILAGPYLASKTGGGDSVLRDDILAGRQKVVPLVLSASRTDLEIKESKNGTAKISGEAKYVAAVETGDILLIVSKDGLFLVGSYKNDESVQVSACGSLDLTSALSNLAFSETVAHKLEGITPQEFTAFYRIIKSAEISGAASRAVEMTVEYTKERKQFGVPVGGFQAVQHGASEMYLKTEALTALTDFAAWAVDSSTEQLSLASSAAITLAVRYGPSVVEKAIQLHGGIGFTWEFDLHLYLRRVWDIAMRFKPDHSHASELLESARKAVAINEF
ncbi:MAG: hypothetical protein D6719_02770 [Candidatus Dadabacteria bacterium]|nr:MAG: hypothetical protein D6719_02770 [Candidatus Dadabacteria bacterium]